MKFLGNQNELNIDQVEAYEDLIGEYSTTTIRLDLKPELALQVISHIEYALRSPICGGYASNEAENCKNNLKQKLASIDSRFVNFMELDFETSRDLTCQSFFEVEPWCEPEEDDELD
jgi:hypothetical protein